MASDWISYNELAWTEEFLADPAEYKDEVGEFITLINETSKEPVQTMLHLGCGAGGHDFHFKSHYKVTGVDLSMGMLKIAKTRNPEVEYIEGDMRTIQLDRRFDCVVIPDSIDYMVSLNDLKQAIHTSAKHLKHGGILLIVCNTEETFQNNNFAYTGEKNNTHVTLLENNYFDPHLTNKYYITMLYLIRRNGKQEKYIEESVAGLFSLETWEDVLRDAGFIIQRHSLNGTYDKYILDSGEYPLTIFICRKD